MRDLVEHIYNSDYVAADTLVQEGIARKLSTALHAAKKRLAAKAFTKERYRTIKEDPVVEAVADELHEARIAIVRARIRGGKIQRRKKVSTVPGMTMRGGKLTRMSPAERRRRKMGARKAKIKARAKKSQAMRKRKLSLMKRKRLGI